ncbi:ATP-binding protein [Rhizobium sp. Root708]|uniref:ATP-binding protein n=1 Tax=Rhizobium sp. Root708 TaxID=1736592 RepID=UPI000A6055B3|nr:ATP-binding protein [Rhizobium sp. Root708]
MTGNRRIWPRSLATRLIVPLMVALAVAQVALFITLRGQQDVVVDGVVHGQALNLTVTLARLVDTSPPAESQRLADAFGTRQSCAYVSAAPPADHKMNASESRLAHLLAERLHQVEARQLQITIEPLARSAHPCDQDVAASKLAGNDTSSGKPFRVVALAMHVPLKDGRWLTVRTAIDVPGFWNRAAILSFLFSSLAVAAVVVVVIRSQTSSLSELAIASERLGRGEVIPPLAVNGPAEVAATRQAFNTMQERLSQFFRDRLRLLASISHDLRTPLTTLRLKAEFIEDDVVREDLVKTIEELTLICEATLAFTRAEAVGEETKLVALDELVYDIVSEFRMAGSNVSAEPLPSTGYPCRPVALKRAVRNLVENATRYGSSARLRLERSSDGILLSVEDDGPGIPEDQIEDAFKPFVRLEASRSTETGGIGLGLSIARNIIVAHGGSLVVFNRPSGGLSAEIRLPNAA